ncbi:MAG: type II toxin-antitoxin system VapC family toxin [Acidobacteriota bacterium]
MKLLLDTQALLFAINPLERLGSATRELLADPSVERYVSAISLWEIAVKVRIGKLPLPSNRTFYLRHLEALQARLLAVEIRHSFAMFDLPLHHKDPFDRMLIAQAFEDGLTLVTQDREFAAYGVPTVW